MSRMWRKVKADWGAWNACSLAEEPNVRLILDRHVVRVRLDRKATSNHCFSSSEAWRAVLDDLVDRGLPSPGLPHRGRVPGLEKAVAAIWDGASVQRCTVHKHRNLVAGAPDRLHDEITADYTDMIYAATPE